MAELKDDGSDLVPVHLVAYEDSAELNIDYSGENPAVENHDELVNSGETYDEIRALKRSAAKEHGLDVIEPGDSLWRDEFEDLESGDSWRVEDLQ